jgi:ribosome biogenesis GTPase
LAKKKQEKAKGQLGLVTKSTGSWYLVQSQGERYQCRIRGKLRLKGLKSTNPVAVGDWVFIELMPNEPGKAVITGLKERQNYIIRKSVNLSKQTQIIAANIDLAILIATLEFPKTHQRFIDRFTVSAQAYGIPVVVVFNKIDLYTPEMMAELEFLEFMYADAGYKVLQTSAQNGTGLAEFKDLLSNKTTLLSGHSGVGKSSLVNKLEPNLNLRTKAISESHLQGQHTTTFAEMFELSFGGKIIDTPGIKGLGLVDMEPEEIGDYFPEIVKLKGGCKFNNCLHLHEPGCAVKAAVENAQFAYPRFESYQSFVQGTDDEEHFRKDIYAE